MAFKIQPYRLFVAVICIGIIIGCSSPPDPLEKVPYQRRSLTQYSGKVRVTASVPSARETRELFGANLYGKGIQPIWLEIENKEEEPVYFFPIGLDPDYFSPFEAAYLGIANSSTDPDKTMQRYYYKSGHPTYIGPGSVTSGFVFSNLDEGTKGFNVDLVRENLDVASLTFFIQVPGLRTDHSSVDFKNLYPPDQIIDYDKQGLMKALEALPCCTTNKKGTEKGDPLNLVIIGENSDVFFAFIRSGWDETETVYGASAIKTGISFLFGGRYRYSPVSALYVFGRPQDIALQKARETIHERNHLRLWLTPYRIKGKPVWIGQISRDIGVRFTTKTITTHKIDPDVDEARSYLVQDLLYSLGLAAFAHVKGVGAAPITEPRQNLTGDPYFTDGFRVVLVLSGNPVDFKDIEYVEWERPPAR